MPRGARIKDSHLPHHIMSKSIQELDLFRSNEDKTRYIYLMEEAKIEFHMDVLAFCLMDNHVHLLIHPNGADISKIMRKINNSYAKYYNKKYERKGHLFYERFKNKSIKDENYLIRVSTYIHNNAKDINEYSDKIDEYPFSSLGYYLGKKSGALVNTKLILNHLDEDYIKSINSYSLLMEIHNNGELEFYNKIEKNLNNNEYRNEKQYIKRNLNKEDVLKAVANILNIKNYQFIRIKYMREFKRFRCIAVVALRALCDLTLKEIGAIIGCISLSTVSLLNKKGIKELKENSSLFDLIISSV